MARHDSEQRARILEAAVRVFGEKGRRGTTIRTVGAAAGVNSALIYYYFENKDELFAECVRMVLRGFLAELAADRRTFRCGRDRIEWLVDHMFGYYSAHPERLRLMAIALVLHGRLMGQCLAPLLREGMPIPVTVLREGMEAGELRRQHPIAAWWNILGVCLFSLLTRDLAGGIDWASMPLGAPAAGERRDLILDLLATGMVADGSGVSQPGGPSRSERTAGRRVSQERAAT